jgi:hypothetical protein
MVNWQENGKKMAIWSDWWREYAQITISIGDCGNWIGDECLERLVPGGNDQVAACLARFLPAR